MPDPTQRGSSSPVEQRWTIDVCATCGRYATYPYTCGHRRTDRAWTTPVVVRPAYPADYFKTLALDEER